LKVHEVKDRNLRCILNGLWCKTEVLEQLKSFTHFDWSKDILRLTREIGDIKMGLDSEGLRTWERIEKAREEEKALNERLMRSLSS